MPNSEERKTPISYTLESGEIRNRMPEKSDQINQIGLSEEELQKVRNGPYWRPVRYSCFALFWIIWLVMFAGAILIVVFAPKK
uniref:Solute carrier family 3 member 2 N-terminal domain-containing protein n=1 Tax=Acrobeloides nanus TaxID=290746 RepID=A0A914C7H9_9BILA